MDLIFIHGPAACGKLTIARELAAISGLRLFHNHLTVDLVASLFDFGTEPFVRLRESIWLDAFREAARERQSLIFTFNPEASVATDFPVRTQELVCSMSGRVSFVELTCPESEIERRIENDSRAQFGKLRSLAQYRTLRESGAFRYPPLPDPVVRIDTSVSTPKEAAREIHRRIAGAAQ